ncbi:hypothetical protein [Helcococcus massiliensis]|uniref:hypothetical protein n=1 Tax=Helcococcus massiliensis TaxID=2040290 RepID=UPI000CDEA64E|nr:hypothetical protein [Helcococcus massiliensis]
MENEKYTAKVMWTGGLDSTLRVLQLSYYDIDIQPYYIYIRKRKTRDKEIKTVNKLAEMIKDRPSTKANILPLIILDEDDFRPIDQDIIDAYKRLIKTQHISFQNILLSQVTRTIPGLEISFERTKDADESLIVDSVITQKGLREQVDETGEIYYFITEETGIDAATVFGNYKFPKRIIEKTKEEEIEEFKELDAMDMAKSTWFCQNPVGDEACGYCLVCRNTVEELGTWRLTEAGKKRHKHWRYHLLKHKIKKGFSLLSKGSLIKYFKNKYK